MYRCEICCTTVPPRTRRHLIAVTRPARYPARDRVYVVRGDGLRYAKDDPGGTGHEIAREIIACPACASAPSHAQQDGA